MHEQGPYRKFVTEKNSQIPLMKESSEGDNKKQYNYIYISLQTFRAVT